MNQPEPSLATVKPVRSAGKPDGTTAPVESAKNRTADTPQTKPKRAPGGTVQAAAGSEPPGPIQPTADRFPALEPQEGLLTFYAPLAKVVEVAGDFNGWHPESNPLSTTGFGEWNVHLTLRPGQYEYRFWVDGAWADDPLARHSTPNPYGSRNAVLKVGLDDRIEYL